MRTAGMAVAAAVILAAAGEARAEDAWAVQVSGGVGRYTGALGSDLEVGGTWGVRVERNALPGVQVGVGYVGGANRFADAARQSPVLQHDGGALSVKASLGDERVQPFVEAGAGLTRFHVRQGDPNAELRGATAVSVPLGVGLQASTGIVRAGLRLGYEWLVAGDPHEGGGGQLVDASISLGARF